MTSHRDVVECPAVYAAASLAETMRAFRDLLCDAAYADVLRHFEGLVAALPDSCEGNVPPRLRALPEPRRDAALDGLPL